MGVKFVDLPFECVAKEPIGFITRRAARRRERERGQKTQKKPTTPLPSNTPTTPQKKRRHQKEEEEDADGGGMVMSLPVTALNRRIMSRRRASRCYQANRRKPPEEIASIAATGWLAARLPSWYPSVPPFFSFSSLFFSLFLSFCPSLFSFRALNARKLVGRPRLQLEMKRKKKKKKKKRLIKLGPKERERERERESEYHDNDWPRTCRTYCPVVSPNGCHSKKGEKPPETRS